MIDVQECRRTLDRRLAARRDRDRRLWTTAQDDARRAIDHIARSYQPERIIQWGSVLDADRFGPRSDIDIAVEGDLDAAAWFRLLGEVREMTRFAVDIVDLRHIEPEFAEIIKMKGAVVYERDSSSD